MPDKKKHITFLIGQLGMGGYEKQMTLLVSKIDRSQFIPLIIVWGSDKGVYRDFLISLGCEVISLEAYSIAEKIKIIKYNLKKNNTKVIHNYSFFLNFITWLSSVGTDTKPIGAVRSNIMYEAKEMFWLFKLLNILFPSILVFNNHAAKDFLNRNIFLPSKKNSMVIQNGIDINDYPKVQYKNSKHIKLLSIGSLTSIKRHDWLIDIAQRLKQEKVDFQIDIIGDGPLYNSLNTEINQAKLNQNIILHGQKESPIDYLLMADIFLHTSSVEGFPNAVLESMAVGLPIVATDVGDINLMIKDEVQGFVAPVNNLELFFKRLMFLIKNPSKRQQIGISARTKVKTHYTDKVLMQKITNLYESLQQV